MKAPRCCNFAKLMEDDVTGCCLDKVFFMNTATQKLQLDIKKM